MARPTKQGIDYFPLDTFFDSKIDLFIASAGAEGYGILIVLWQLIYRDCGYYIPYNDDLLLILRKHTLSSMETIDNAVSNAVNRGLFSKKMLKKEGILTSSGIQKRYFMAGKQKKHILTARRHLLVDVSMYTNLVSTNGNRIISNENTTKEEVDIKGNIKGNVKGNYGPFDNVLLTEKEFGKLTAQFNGQSDSMINRLSEYLASSGKKYKSHYATLLSWAHRDTGQVEPNKFAGAK